MPESSVERTLGLVLGKLEGIEDRLERADTSRAVIHQRLDNLVTRTAHLETDMTTTKTTVKAMQAVTDDVTKLRTQAQGAGTLGRWLLRIGIGIITLAGWIVGAFAYLTGRPPP